MTVTVVQFNPEIHYSFVTKWWKEENWPILPLSHLPKFGLMAIVGGAPAAAGWIYQTDSAICWFEWIIANPEIRKEPRREALSSLIATAKDAAKAMGFQTMFMSIKNQSLISRLKSHGFGGEELGMTNLTFNFQGGK